MTAEPGTRLADPAWLADRVGALGEAWDCADRRVIGTLWWYMASSVLLDLPLRQVAAGSAIADPALAALTCDMRADGSLAAVRSALTVADTPAFATALRPAVGSVIVSLAEVSGAGTPALWAIASDALANRALDAGVPEVASSIAAQLSATMPQPRFIEVSGRRFVRRSSCCVIYETGKAAKCVSCPRREPEERAGLLTELVRRGR
ncbi:hypothetical protein [Antrihabitans sp. YC2-6]|uniref:hypothetical protein n=1 Tax=Antrihabitans sp. YC2-6 TaxID=2799498 RepID=UPI0018F76878|nr:hypothetical protein [Antrihabitans sp. YC2-6]MBJ8345244.1 hypothetical protein [Antrihabitans sp. YC2-6]